MDIKKEFGKKVKQYRIYAELSQESLAEKAGITPQTLSGIENGYGFPSYPVLCRIIEALNVPPVSLFIFPNWNLEISDEEMLEILLENFRVLDEKERKLILHTMKYLREEKSYK